jgi:L-serine/L-threonine ammonia-lyase
MHSFVDVYDFLSHFVFVLFCLAYSLPNWLSKKGNAGLAATTVASKLGMKIQVIVPETTKPMVIDKLRTLGATVQVHGTNWNEADILARQLVEQDPTTTAYISPYDHELIWTGHSTVIDEIYEQLNPHHAQPAVIIASVGGGGLLCGILEGLQRRQYQDHHHHSSNHTNQPPTVIAAETIGASSFGQAYEKGELISLSSIDSIATSLGALQVTPISLQRAKTYQQQYGNHTFQTSICTDAEAVYACSEVTIFCCVFITDFVFYFSLILYFLSRH